jgi:hypothetical protein
MTINGFVHSILDYPLIYEHLKNNNNTHSNKAILIKTPTYLQQSYIDEKKPRFTKTCLEFSNP